jgi:hypothetical protein
MSENSVKLKIFLNKTVVQSYYFPTDMSENDVFVEHETSTEIHLNEETLTPEQPEFSHQEPIIPTSDTSDDSDKNLVDSVEPKTSYFIELVNVIILGFSFMFIFAAFNTTANYMSTLHKG